MTRAKKLMFRLSASFMWMMVAVALITVCPEPTRAQAQSQKTAPAPNLFQLPRYALLQETLVRPVRALFRQRKFDKAEEELRKLVVRYSNWPTHYYMLAAAMALQDKPEGALENLQAAMARGFSNAKVLEQDPSFQSLRGKPQFQRLLSEMKLQVKSPIPAFRTSVTPRAVAEGRALVDETNTVWERRANLLLSVFQFPAANKPALVYKGSDPTFQLLNDWHRNGTSAGNYGDLYDNRDNGHSRLPPLTFPQLTHVRYSEQAKAARLNYGVNSDQLFNTITLGNSSTALTGAGIWRSQARLMLTTPRLAARAFLQYANNQLYIYPEHRDHDIKHGDVFPANTPYMLISQGSSGSDGPLLRAVTAILAAFSPDVKIWLRDRKLIAPTVQMIFRSGLKSVKTAEDYLSARAHPTVFDSASIDVDRMIHLAHDLRVDSIPPSVQLRILNESKPTPGVDYFGPSDTDEILFTTPSAIARLHRSTAQDRRMVVTAGGTKDPNGKPLRFVWKLLRGDPEKVSIKPLSSDASTVEIRVKWHDQRPVPFAETLKTNRVDIGVFVHNGANYSSPSFVSFYSPPNQSRIYGEGGRIDMIAYNAESLSKRYADPVLFAGRAWRDRYKYTDQGQLQGWFRVSGRQFERFTRHGAKVVAVDGAGRPIRAELISYQTRKSSKSKSYIVPKPTNSFVHYDYSGPTDLLGRAKFCNQAVCHHH